MKEQSRSFGVMWIETTCHVEILIGRLLDEGGERSAGNSTGFDSLFELMLNVAEFPFDVECLP